MKQAQDYEASHNSTMAYKCYCEAVDITFDLFIPLIKKLIAENVPYIIAPYEADAEIAYLSRANLVDFVITEDSDLIAYGCSNILFKLDMKGMGMQFNRNDLFSESLGLNEFSEEMILAFCILLKCDYLNNPKGWGWKRIFPLVQTGRKPSKIIELVCEGAHMDESCVLWSSSNIDTSKISSKPLTLFDIKLFSIRLPKPSNHFHNRSKDSI